MRYTPDQLREAVGLSREAFQHWKQVLPGFACGSSYGPRFISRGCSDIGCPAAFDQGLRHPHWMLEDGVERNLRFIQQNAMGYIGG